MAKPCITLLNLITIGIKIMNESLKASLFTGSPFQPIYDRLDKIDAKLDFLEMKLDEIMEDVNRNKEEFSYLQSAFSQRFGNY